MQIILLHDVEKVGRRGEAVAVADGYARNFLFPQGLAVRADTAKKRELEQRLRSLEVRDARDRGGAEERARALEGVSITIRTAASEEGRLYGSVTAQMIAAALAEQGHEVDPKQIELGEPLKALGEYPIPLRLHRDVQTDIALTVERA
jgi:large subunit ribosomal protein L9